MLIFVCFLLFVFYSLVVEQSLGFVGNFLCFFVFVVVFLLVFCCLRAVFRLCSSVVICFDIICRHIYL